MGPLETERLSDVISRKRACLVQLGDLGQRQADLIEGDDMTELLKVLAAKQHLIGSLQGIERELAPFRDQDPEERQWRTPEDRARCAHEANLCRQLLAEIVIQEKQSEGRLAERRNEAARRLRLAHAASQACGAYQSDTRTNTGMLDVMSES
jgi:hypothetical protein